VSIAFNAAGASAANPSLARDTVGIVSLADSAVAAALAPAGLEFIERELNEVALPLRPDTSAASSLPADRRFDAEPGEVVDVDDLDWSRRSMRAFGVRAACPRARVSRAAVSSGVAGALHRIDCSAG
jgi:hypothetical protein